MVYVVKFIMMKGILHYNQMSHMYAKYHWSLLNFYWNYNSSIFTQYQQHFSRRVLKQVSNNSLQDSIFK